MKSKKWSSLVFSRLALSTLIVLICCHFTYSQQFNSTQSLKKAQELTSNDQYDSSINLILEIQFNLKDSTNSLSFLETFRLLGENFMDKSKYKKSDSVFQKGLEKVLKSLGAEHSMVSDYYHSISRNLGAWNKYDEALAMEEKAIRLRKDIYGLNHPKIADSYNQLGFNLRLKGQYDTTLVLYEEAIRIYSETEGDFSKELSRNYVDMAWVYAAKGQLSKSLEFAIRSF